MTDSQILIFIYRILADLVVLLVVIAAALVVADIMQGGSIK